MQEIHSNSYYASQHIFINIEEKQFQYENQHISHVAVHIYKKRQADNWVIGGKKTAEMEAGSKKLPTKITVEREKI